MIACCQCGCRSSWNRQRRRHGRGEQIAMLFLRYPSDSDSSCELIDALGRSFFVAGAAEQKERTSLLFVDRYSTVVRVVVTGASLVSRVARGSSGGSGNVKQHCNMVCMREARNSIRRDSAVDPNPSI